jgi:hypothetical protein
MVEQEKRFDGFRLLGQLYSTRAGRAVPGSSSRSVDPSLERAKEPFVVPTLRVQVVRSWLRATRREGETDEKNEIPYKNTTG